MSITDDRRAMVALWIVTALATLLFAGFLTVAIVEEPFAALYGLGGFLAGALLAACIAITRRRSTSGEARHDRMLEAFAERVESLEAERARVIELEERIDFAERLLAKERAGRQLEGNPR